MIGEDVAAPLSSLDEQFAAYQHAYHQKREGLWPMRVIPPGAEKQKGSQQAA